MPSAPEPILLNITLPTAAIYGRDVASSAPQARPGISDFHPVAIRVLEVDGSISFLK